MKKELLLHNKVTSPFGASCTRCPVHLCMLQHHHPLYHRNEYLVNL